VQTDFRFPFAATGRQLALRLLATSDLHMHLTGHDYQADRAQSGLGLVRIATLLEAGRAAAPQSLYFDNGDLLQGTSLGDLWAETGPGPEGHPAISALAHLGCDAATPGNHDFNYGLEYLQACLAGAPYPVVSANVITKDGAPLLLPWSVLRRSFRDGGGQAVELGIGVIGALPPQAMQWDHHHLHGRVVIDDIVAAVARELPALRAAGADLVVALCHSGIGGESHVPGMEDAAVPLAALPGIDVVIAGHSHQPFPGPGYAASAAIDPVAGRLHGKPAVLPGAWGSQLGHVDLLLEPGPDGWTVAQAMVGLWSTDGTSPAPRLSRLLQPAHRATQAHMARPVGHAAAPLHSYLDLIAPGPALSLAAEAQQAAVTRLLAGSADAHLPVVSAVSPFKSGGRGGPGHFTHVPAGPLSLRHVGDLYLFPNSVRAFRITGAGLAEWIERAASAFSRLRPGESEQELLQDGVPGYDIDSVFGVTATLDLAQPARFDPVSGALVDPAARRVVRLQRDGRDIDPEAPLILATNSYRAGGGGHYPGACPENVLAASPVLIRDELARFLAGPRPPHGYPPALRFARIPGTGAVFETAPALRHLEGEMSRLGLEDLGDSAAGFARMRLSLDHGPLIDDLHGYPS